VVDSEESDAESSLLVTLVVESLEDDEPVWLTLVVAESVEFEVGSTALSSRHAVASKRRQRGSVLASGSMIRRHLARMR
jgi:hypothetical protein